MAFFSGATGTHIHGGMLNSVVGNQNLHHNYFGNNEPGAMK